MDGFPKTVIHSTDIFEKPNIYQALECQSDSPYLSGKWPLALAWMFPIKGAYSFKILASFVKIFLLKNISSIENNLKSPNKKIILVLTVNEMLPMKNIKWHGKGQQKSKWNIYKKCDITYYGGINWRFSLSEVLDAISELKFMINCV